MEPSLRLSEHFSSKEFECPCCQQIKYSNDFIFTLEQFRQDIDKPILISSGYRCPKHNQDVGGSPRSQHMEGRAADITVPGRNSYRLAYEAAVVRFLDIPIVFDGIGCYPESSNQFIHVDIRGNACFWTDRGGIRQFMQFDEFYNFLYGKVKDEINEPISPDQMADIASGDLPGDSV